VSEITELLVSWALTTALSFAVVLGHERFMSEERLERAWPPASRAAALVAFGPLALPFHFAKTLGHFRGAGGVLGVLLGLALGAFAAVLVVLASGVVLSAVESLTSG
jgi:hypothetical protein